MNTRALALSIRALREETRSRGAYLLRGLLVSLLILAVWTTQQISTRLGIGGSMLLTNVGWADFLLISLLVSSVFSTSITEEKENQSLGLLRLAGFTPVSIILGKSIGVLTNTALLVVVQVPFCMLAITLGGVTVDQVAWMFGLILAYLVFGYGLGTFASVVCKRNASAARLAFAILLTYHLLPPIGNALIRTYLGLGSLPFLENFLADWSGTTVFSGLVAVSSLMGSAQGLDFTGHVMVNLALGLGFLILGWLLFERFHRDELPVDEPRPTGLLGRTRESRPSMRCWSRALLWKDYQFASGGRRRMLLRTLVYLALVGLLLWLVPEARDDRQLGSILMIGGLVTAGAELLGGASRLFEQEVKDRTLGSLMTLPRSLLSITWWKVLGSAAAVVPAVGYFSVGVMLYPSGFRDALPDSWHRAGTWYFILQVPLALVWTTYHSLRFPRAAPAMALGSVFLANILLAIVVANLDRGLRSAEWIFWVGNLVILALLVLGVAGIRARLHRLASEA